MNSQQLQALAEKYGSPLYVYNADQIISQYNRIINSFSSVENLKINYAVKANTNVSILKLFKKLNSGIDTVSFQEVQLGLEAGFEPKDIIFTPNGVSLEEIERVAQLGVQINIDNISVLEQFGHHYPNIPVCVRINPHIMAGGNHKISELIDQWKSTNHNGDYINTPNTFN